MVETDPIGTPVVTVTATDLDEGDNGAIFYIITEDNGRGVYTLFFFVNKKLISLQV